MLFLHFFFQAGTRQACMSRVQENMSTCNRSREGTSIHCCLCLALHVRLVLTWKTRKKSAYFAGWSRIFHFCCPQISKDGNRWLNNLKITWHVLESQLASNKTWHLTSMAMELNSGLERRNPVNSPVDSRPSDCKSSTLKLPSQTTRICSKCSVK